MSELHLDKDKLNRRERYKARLKPYDYYLNEFETIDFENLGEGDRYYLQDFGIFNTEFLEDEFTIRLRVAGGRIDAKRFALLAQIVKEYDLTVVLTARGGIQLHDIYVDDVATIWHRLNDNGLTTWQSFGDNVRNIVSDVYDGVGKYSKIEVYPIIEQMQNYILKNPEYVGMLPRRVSIAISGNSANVSPFFSNDLYFALAQKEGEYGFCVFMGGKNTEIAQPSDIFLRSDEVFEFFKAFVATFYKHGSRYSRSKTRLFYLLEEMGIERFKELLAQEYGKSFESGGELVLHKGEFEEFEQLLDGSYAYCYQSSFGKLSSDEIEQITKIAEQNGCEIRLGSDQNIYFIGLKEKSVVLPSPKQSATIVACAGNLCPYAVWSIKEETKYLPLDRIYKHRIKVGFSGCAKGCGRHRHTDIGLIGLKTNNFGDVDGGARIFLGAHYHEGQDVARQLFSMVPFVHLHEVVSIVIDLFELSGCEDFEHFSASVLAKLDMEFVAVWVLGCFATKQSIALEPACTEFVAQKMLLKQNFAGIDFLDPMEESFSAAISKLGKKLWSVDGKDPHYIPPIQRNVYR